MPLLATTSSSALDRAEVARVDIKVDGASLGDEGGVSVLRVEVRHELGRPSSCVVDTADLDAADLEWIDGSTVQEGRLLHVAMGQGERSDPVFIGEIIGLDLDVGQGDAPQVAIRSYDRLHRLARARKTRVFVDQRDSQIAAAIADEHDLRLSGPDSPLIHPYVMQREQTDLAFLLARARGLGYVLRVEDTALLFAPRDLAADGAVTATMGSNLLELHVSTSVLGQVGGVAARGWDPDEQKALLAEVKAADLASRMGGRTSGPALADDCFTAEATVVTDLPIVSADAARLAAAAELEAMALRHVRCRGRMLGAAALRPGVILKVVGFGARFSGNYWLTRVVHTYDRDGFTTDFEGERTAT